MSKWCPVERDHVDDLLDRIDAAGAPLDHIASPVRTAGRQEHRDVACDVEYPRRSSDRIPGGVDGGQVHAWVAQHRPDLAQRIVFITGDIANEETVATLRETGAPCVEKPFRVQQFIEVVSKTFGKNE